MFRNSFVAAVKVGGKVLRENYGVVTLPWGTEYGVLLKNLTSRRAQVKVSVDGQDATEGTKLILQPNSSLELERFIRNGNLRSGNCFKFIERTPCIEKHRGNREDDGLIRIEFWAEKETVDVPVVKHHYYDEYHSRPYRERSWYVPYYPTRPWWDNGGIICNSTTSSLGGAVGGEFYKSSVEKYQGGKAQASSGARMTVTYSSAPAENVILRRSRSLGLPSNDTGITVPGSESKQAFYSACGFELESNSHVIVLQLRGEVGGLPVESAVTVDHKPVCSICGKKNEPNDKFCRECGTALQLI